MMHDPMRGTQRPWREPPRQTCHRTYTLPCCHPLLHRKVHWGDAKVVWLVDQLHFPLRVESLLQGEQGNARDCPVSTPSASWPPQYDLLSCPARWLCTCSARLKAQPAAGHPLMGPLRARPLAQVELESAGGGMHACTCPMLVQSCGGESVTRASDDAERCAGICVGVPQLFGAARVSLHVFQAAARGGESACARLPTHEPQSSLTGWPK